MPLETCPYCGAPHKFEMCPKLKAIEYFEDGGVKRVEFKTAADFGPQINVPSPLGTGPWLSNS
jgi:hypothetical protein